ncbi:MAG TPA: Crp/Fnr family transcriptional regulator [Marmoricola sp.]|nr:Crp/Fnr family transcriptional regulator [Marmoricola sp.]
MLADWPLLRSLGAEERAALLAVARRRPFERDDVVCHEGDRADALHLVASGRLAVTSSLPSGATAMLNVLGPGDYFGELALLRPAGRRTATVRALEPAVTLAVEGRAFRRLCETSPGLEHALSVLLADQVETLSRHLVEALYEGLDVRVNRRLAELCRIYGHGDGCVELPLTQSQLAELVGGTRPSVNQLLQRLERQGVVALGRGRITVVDPAALTALR